MNRSASRKTLLCFVLITLSHLSAEAAEIRLKSKCYCNGTLVRLGDIADVFDSDQREAERLASIELFPTPGRSRTVRLREIQERLSLHGVNLIRCRLYGASRVLIEVEGEQTVEKSSNNASSRAVEQRARQRVRQAIVQYLQDRVDSRFDWEVELQIDDSSSRLLAAAAVSRLTVQGGRQPWVGPQEFTVSFLSRKEEVRLAIAAEVKLPEQVVVAIRVLSKGDIVRKDQVRLQQAPVQFSQRNYFHRLSDVIGKEVAQSVRAEQPLDKRHVRAPLLVRRGDIVTVYSRAPGIQIRTRAVARGDGAKGDVILVQTLDKKHKYNAQVSDVHEVVVTALGPRARTNPKK